MKLDKIEVGSNMAHNVLLSPYDVIVVPIHVKRWPKVKLCQVEIWLRYGIKSL